MRSPGEAARPILAALRPLSVERLRLNRALDRVLAEDITSPIDLPPWTNSAMDGYAVRSEDFNAGTGPLELRVVEEIRAGRFPTRAIGAGECARIFTGAPLPEGADGLDVDFRWYRLMAVAAVHGRFILAHIFLPNRRRGRRKKRAKAKDSRFQRRGHEGAESWVRGQGG